MAVVERAIEIDPAFFIVMGALFILVALVTALFSLLTLTTILACWRTQCRSTSNFLVCNSCVASLFFDVILSIQIPSLFQVDQHERQGFQSTPCRIRGFLFLFACTEKMYSYLIQAISRYFITVLYKRKSLLTYRTNGSLILASWIHSFVLAAGMLISPVAFQYEVESRLCVMTSKVFHTSFTAMVLAFVVPVSIIIFLYLNILWRTVLTNQIQPDAVSKRNNKRNLTVFQNILILLTIPFVGGSPFLLSIIINRISRSPWPLYAASIFFISLSSAIESLVLFFTNNEVKRIVYGRIGLHQVVDGDDAVVVRPRMRVWTLSNRIHALSAAPTMNT